MPRLTSSGSRTGPGAKSGGAYPFLGPGGRASVNHNPRQLGGVHRQREVPTVTSGDNPRSNADPAGTQDPELEKGPAENEPLLTLQGAQLLQAIEKTNHVSFVVPGPESRRSVLTLDGSQFYKVLDELKRNTINRQLYLPRNIYQLFSPVAPLLTFDRTEASLRDIVFRLYPNSAHEKDFETVDRHNQRAGDDAGLRAKAIDEIRKIAERDPTPTSDETHRNLVKNGDKEIVDRYKKVKAANPQLKTTEDVLKFMSESPRLHNIKTARLRTLLKKHKLYER